MTPELAIGFLFVALALMAVAAVQTHRHRRERRAARTALPPPTQLGPGAPGDAMDWDEARESKTRRRQVTGSPNGFTLKYK